MQVTETVNEGLKRAYTIVVPAGDIEEKLSARLSEIAKTAQMPGFRPGKVPVTLLRKTYGDAVMGEVLEQTVSESTETAISDKELRPLGQPKIEIKKFETGSDLEYDIEFELFPEIELTDFSSIKLERLKVPADEEQVDAMLKQMADGQKDTKPVAEKRKIKSGDIAVIDFVGKVDGEEFPGGKADAYPLEIGSSMFIPGFEEQLIDREAGDKLDVDVTFPENYAEELAGKDAAFSVEIKELREGVPAEIDDELAKKMGAENLEELKKSLRQTQENDLDSFSRMRLKRELLDALDAQHKFELPGGLIDQEFGAIWEQFEHQRENHPDQIDEDDKEKSDDELKAQYREIAERRVRLGLLLAEIGRANEIQVSPEEVNRAIMQEAQRYQGREQEVFDYYKKTPEAMQTIQSPLLEEKVVDFILELAQVSDKQATMEELVADEEAEAKKAKSADADKPAKKKRAPRKKKAPAKGKDE
ncbi:MAG: trigger factor [Rhodospirillales bacterium]|jgi:trigger factor|nr:trigger factor [Rhodospirillaceae bacterium]MDP6643520.1 trigger factor [Rhodospirillales bacterium]MDP6840814.1 trigger factor [Rhodospirillales bacterium]|tara:strand:+ start:998 stop:2419 length:1422 start_codon:yes stop_codon:yes gene_type:complete